VTRPGWFEVLVDEEPREGRGLPDDIRAVYGGDWTIPFAGELPYVYSNFVVSRDGRASFRESGYAGGGAVSGYDDRDRWLMAVLRARADAVVVGDGTAAAEPEHVWTADAIYPAEAERFAALRDAESRAPNPLQVIVSLTGEFGPSAMLERDDLDALVVTPDAGEAAVDLGVLLARLRARGAHTVLCEGGPHLYGALIASGTPFDEFLTLSPLVVGEADHGVRRPSLVEGTAFAPEAAPRSRLLSVRRGGDYLYLRSRYEGRVTQSPPPDVSSSTSPSS